MFAALIGQFLPSEKMETALICLGENFHGSCPLGKKVAIQDVHYGTKLSSTCGYAETSAECCKKDPSDCILPYVNHNQHIACSGRQTCEDVTLPVGNSTTCGTLYPMVNHYMSADYYCIDSKYYM